MKCGDTQKMFCCMKVKSIRKLNKLSTDVVILTETIKLSWYFYHMVYGINLKCKKNNGRIIPF